MKAALNAIIVLDSLILSVIISLFAVDPVEARSSNELPEGFSEIAQPVSRYLPSPNTKDLGSGLISDVLDASYISHIAGGELKKDNTVQSTAALPKKAKKDIGITSPSKEVAKYTQDTIDMQYKTLEKINHALVRGAITAQEAAGLQIKVNAISASESWYKSYGLPVPDSIIKENINKLQALDRNINKKLPLKLSSAGSFKNDPASQPKLSH